MSLVIPKKKKIIRIVIIIASRVQAFLDNGVENTSSEELLDLLTSAKPTIYGFDESNWSQEQQDVWTQIEAIEATLDPEALSEVTEADMQDFADDLENALDKL